MKTCPRCERELPVGQFSKDSTRSDGLATYCKACVREYQQANKKRISQRNFKRNNGIGLLYKNFILAAQGWNCPICGKTLEPNSSDACLDHDHIYSDIRGVLCRACNGYIGKFGDNIIGVAKGIIENTDNELLPKAYDYLLEAF
jgi:hypothetical protein